VSRRSSLAALAVIAGLLCAPRPARAWGIPGHEVIARVAWDNLSPRTRRRVTALLERAPADADLASLRPTEGTASAQERMLFVRAAAWADLMRFDDHPARKAAYDHPGWHYINQYWPAQDASGVGVDTAGMRPDSINIVERLRALAPVVRDTSAAAADRAIALAWVMHLVGDVHQPLHCSARVTTLEPSGDAGGNTFQLDGRRRLHGYWDHAIDDAIPRQPSDVDDDAYIGRVAHAVERAVPRREVRTQIANRDEALWARSSLEKAVSDVYTPALHRGQRPPADYDLHADSVALRAAAVAGYRLADLLERLLGD
jgi:hypothetical protein